ncbi:hypothetical protein Z517_07523 [Fonsecaea pedrosoi CBS 271.37]|uniref:Unplaced genomic scaffold supercont1.5, whole genome shotgun sequence n=1 Tax=Fonsecaea pedrosoi CBS 271.37 TaxID=1442368 RepID=A0A0D2GGG0_9EURO|nr:uncharacterized protein Z517_07523 [Fonsecaea pedrosoi CBS 271.37]KIW77690.1 hypothetical protein Z517_07523 [Fonsecaea pedrosoi CBS 271.37]
MSSASDNKSEQQDETTQHTLRHSHAFVAHTSSSLKDSKLLWPSKGSRVHTVGVQDEELVAVTRALGDLFQGRDAEQVLAGFCQKIFLLFQTDTKALGIASVIAEQLFKSFDDKGSFGRETMPMGIQGVQELNWTTQNEELAPLRKEYQTRVKAEGGPLPPFSMTDSKGNQLLFAGLEEETLIIIDKTMLSAGLVRYRHHTFDIGVNRAKCSWQLFVKIKHRDFLRSWFRTSAAPIQDMAVAIMTAMRIFSEARYFINEPGRRTEAVILVETIRRGEFYMNSTVIDDDEGTPAAPGTLTPSDSVVSAHDGSEHNVSASPNSCSRSDNSHSRPATSSSSSSSGSSSSSSTMVKRSIPDSTVNMQASSTKKGKKKRSTRKKPQKKTAPLDQTQANESPGDKSLSEIVDKMADAKLDAPTDIPPSASAVQHDGGSPTENSNVPTSMKVKRKAKDEELRQARTTEGLGRGLGDTISRRSSDSDRTVTPADFSNKDVAEDSSSKGQQGIQKSGDDDAVLDTKGKGHTKKEDNNTTTTLTESVSRERSQPVDQGPQHPPAAFKFDSFDPRLRCLKPDCRNMTSCWDCAVVICPACGTDSFTRYCRKQHLYDDIQRHWAMECGRNKIKGPIDRNTIRPKQLPKRPYTFGQYHDMVERHRQAVYRAMEDADFFIFNDVEMLDDSIVQPTQEQWNSVRGTGAAVLQIIFPDDMTPHSDRQVFNYHIQRILSVGKPLAEDSCMRAMEMIRSALVMSGSWREEVLTYLCMQLTGEWGNFKVPERFYNVEQVNGMWQMHRVLMA